MPDFLVGTSSWTDKTLLESGWYPAGAKTPEARLSFYASCFNLVEVDATYYGLPAERNRSRAYLAWLGKKKGETLTLVIERKGVRRTLVIPVG